MLWKCKIWKNQQVLKQNNLIFRLEDAKPHKFLNKKLLLQTKPVNAGPQKLEKMTHKHPL